MGHSISCNIRKERRRVIPVIPLFAGKGNIGKLVTDTVSQQLAAATVPEDLAPPIAAGASTCSDAADWWAPSPR